MKTLAPIALFCYKRLDTLTQTIEALQKNDLAAESELFIFSDGPKKAADEAVIADIRNYLKTVSGFKKLLLSKLPPTKGWQNLSLVELQKLSINMAGSSF